jgi:hypothetical protein
LNGPSSEIAALKRRTPRALMRHAEVLELTQRLVIILDWLMGWLEIESFHQSITTESGAAGERAYYSESRNLKQLSALQGQELNLIGKIVGQTALNEDLQVNNGVANLQAVGNDDDAGHWQSLPRSLIGVPS